MQHLSIDIETYSSVNLQKAGVYKYAESPDFDILLFGYSVDGGAVHVIDLACGEKIPAEIVDALSDESVTKWAFNAQFERVCLSNYLDTWLSPDSWHCTMVWSATLGLPLSLEGVGAVLGLEKQKLTEGKNLIKYFCVPCAPNTVQNIGTSLRRGVFVSVMRLVYGEKHSRFQELEALIQEKNDTREILTNFINKLQDLTGEQTEFREELWGGLVDHIRIDEKSSTIVFRGGIEITI